MVQKNKARDIARSVLPAGRQAAKSHREDAATIRRNNRRKIRQSLNKARNFADIYDFEDDVNYYPDRDINYIREDRRLADNIGPLMRWAQHHGTRIGDPEQAYEFVRNTLPKNLAGNHALSHAKQADALRIAYAHEYRFPYRSSYLLSVIEAEKRINVVKDALKIAFSYGAQASIETIVRQVKEVELRDVWGKPYLAKCSNCVASRSQLDVCDIDALVDRYFGRIRTNRGHKTHFYFPYDKGHIAHRIEIGEAIYDFLVAHNFCS